jgi:hypothetical protein
MLPINTMSLRAQRSNPQSVARLPEATVAILTRSFSR